MKAVRWKVAKLHKCRSNATPLPAYAPNDRPWLPLIAACVPTAMNLWTSAVLRNRAPETSRLKASAGPLAKFALLFVLVAINRQKLVRSLDYITNTSK